MRVRPEVLVVLGQVWRSHSYNASWMPCIRDGAPHYHDAVPVPPPDVHNWIACTKHLLNLQIASEWVGRPDCGAVVIFSGLVRDHAEGVSDVTHIDYEAFEEQVLPRLEALAERARRSWPEIGRIVLWHRDGRVLLGESSVVVAVSTPQRGSAFDAAEFLIDTLKATIPIWKKEFWNGGSDWALGTQHIVEISELGSDSPTVRT